MGNLTRHIATRLPAPFLLRQMPHSLSGQVVFPFYHAVSDVPLQHLAHLYPIRTRKAFERDLDFLLSHFEPVSMKEVLAHPEEKRGGRLRMVLSFDDGLAQCHEVVLPILQKKGVPAVFFLNNDFIDNRGLFYRYKVSLLLEIGRAHV